MRAMRGPTSGLLAAMVAAALPATAQEPEGPDIRLGGFISASAFAQDQSFAFSNGQAAEWAAPEEATVDPWFLGGDVRNTRLTLRIGGPVVVGEWKANGVIEGDFFGPLSGTGAFSGEQAAMRVRLAYVDLTNGRTTLRIGQAWAPLFGFFPASLSHIAFPLGYGAAGVVGWHFPGIFVHHTLTGPEDPLTARLTLAALRGSWNDPENDLGPGEASLVPQLEGRIDLEGKAGGTLPWSAYLVGHLDRKDLSGVGARFTTPEEGEDELTGTALEVGARLTPRNWTLHGNAYRGRAIGQQLGHITQFGDITGWGAWAQAGYAFTPQWSAWLFAGTADPDDEDVIASGNARLRNVSVSPMLRYTLGAYALGLEWLRSTTEWSLEGEPRSRSANQVALSVFYSF